MHLDVCSRGAGLSAFCGLTSADTVAQYYRGKTCKSRPFAQSFPSEFREGDIPGPFYCCDSLLGIENISIFNVFHAAAMVIWLYEPPAPPPPRLKATNFTSWTAPPLQNDVTGLISVICGHRLHLFRNDSLAPMCTQRRKLTSLSPF